MHRSPPPSPLCVLQYLYPSEVAPVSYLLRRADVEREGKHYGVVEGHAPMHTKERCRQSEAPPPTKRHRCRTVEQCDGIISFGLGYLKESSETAQLSKACSRARTAVTLTPPPHSTRETPHPARLFTTPFARQFADVNEREHLLRDPIRD